MLQLESGTLAMSWIILGIQWLSLKRGTNPLGPCLAEAVDPNSKEAGHRFEAKPEFIGSLPVPQRVYGVRHECPK
jgi:hypothetical protein